MTDELKPCPFCGCEPMRTSNHTVLCQTCNREVLPEVWDTRPIEDALRSQLATRDALIEKLVEAGDGLVRYSTIGNIDQWDVLVAEWQAMKKESVE